MKRGNLLDVSEPHETRFNVGVSTVFKELSHKESECQHEVKEPVWKCRYVVVLIGFFSFFFVNVYRTSMSITIVAMVNNSAMSEQTKASSDSCPHLLTNSTEKYGGQHAAEKGGDFMWSPRIQGYILSSFFLGQTVGSLPSAMLAERLGCKWFLFSASVVTSVCTLLIPVLSWMSASAVIVAQALRGLGQGFVLPLLPILTANWFPKVERGPLLGVMHSGLSVGTTFGVLFAGFLCESNGGWPSSLYAAGAGGVLLSISVLFFLVENPQVHPSISKAESDFILGNQEIALSKRRPNPPWRKILSSVPVYVLAYSYFGQGWATSQFMIVHSLFLGNILHYPIGQNGLFIAIPFIFQFICSNLAACVSLYIQKKNIAGVDFLRKFWTFISCLGFSASLLGVYFAGCNRTLSVVFAILSAGWTGIAFVGTWVVATDMTPTFAGTIHAFCCTIGFLSSFILPLVVGYLTDGMQTIEQWNKAFFISIAIVMSSGICFAIFGSAEVQPWNYVRDDSSTNSERMVENGKKIAESDEKKETTRF